MAGKLLPFPSASFPLAPRRPEPLRPTTAKHENTIRGLAEEAAKEQEIISRCDLMLSMDTERQAPALSERGQE